MYAGVLAVLLVVVLLTAWVAGRQSSPPGTGSTDAVRLGPVAGEAVAAYLDRTRAVLAGPWPRLALVQYAAAVDAATAVDAARALGGVPLQAVFRVPIPRVQTGVRRVTLTSAAPVPAVLAAETQAAAQARDQAVGSTGRVVEVARAEVAALSARCPCVLALVVRLDAPRAVAAVPPLRAVEVAAPGARPEALAVSPLLPDQTDVVGPVPDDGPVPPTP